MKYIFFDVESIDIKHETICSFGYYLTDENFNILEYNDILINPNIEEEKYDKWAINKIIKYDLNVIKKAPTFSFYYEKIKELLTNPEHLAFAFAKDNEKKYLNSECKRHRVPLFFDENNKIYDVQKIYKNYKGDKNETGLKKCIEDLSIDTSLFNEHTSIDDALMTMLIVKSLCKIENTSLENLTNKYITNYTKKKL